MKSYSLFLALFFYAATSNAQSVDLDIPTEINIIQGRLAVTFYDEVKEEAAHALITSFNYDVLKSTFEPRTIFTSSKEMLSQSVINKLEQDERIIEVTQTALPSDIQATNGTYDNSQIKIAISFKSHISKKEAENVVVNELALPFSYTIKLPNEIVIEVGDQDEEAVALLQDRDEVRWVTYIGVPGYP